MLFFHGHEWQLVPGRSVLEVRICKEHRTPADVTWHWEAHFIAAGGSWRRVRHRDRPSLEVRVGFFEPNVRHWLELERVSFWDLEKRESDRTITAAGLLETRYRPGLTQGPRPSRLVDHIWRFARRSEHQFTIELAAFADGRDIFKALSGITVAPDGEEAPLECDEAFWRANAQLYMVETLPLGVVHVEVPRNAGDPEAHARQRARSLVGLEEPHWWEVRDFAKRQREEWKDHCGDLHAELHFHDWYEE